MHLPNAEETPLSLHPTCIYLTRKKRRYFVGAGVVWTWGGDACVALVLFQRILSTSQGDASVPSTLPFLSRPYEITPSFFLYPFSLPHNSPHSPSLYKSIVRPSCLIISSTFWKRRRNLPLA